MKYGFIKTACASPSITVADWEFNGKNIIDEAVSLAKAGVEIAVFPELSITGYSCGDLFLQKTLQQGAVSQLEEIARKTASLNMMIFVGLPFVQPDGIFNVVAALYKGDVLALIPKANVPVCASCDSFNESRIFTPAGTSMETRFVSIGSFEDVPFGTNIIISDSKDSSIAVSCEIGHDLLGALSPSSFHTKAGATIIVNPYAMNEEVGRADFFRSVVRAQSGRCMCGYASAGAGQYESTQDCVFAGHNIIAENGAVLEEGGLFSSSAIISDIDVERIISERQKLGFGKGCDLCDLADDYVLVEADFDFAKEGKLNRKIEPFPFIPSDIGEEKVRCQQVIDLQAHGLARRLSHIHCQNAVIGLSGGLDSTLALTITCRAFDLCKLPKSGITAITMPCFGTTDRTYNNACQLARDCGVQLKEVKIADSVRQHFEDIGQDEKVHDVTYENSQARERTQVLMDYANKVNGIVIGTGDLSELALGWCTYNGDHMSMYGVNSSIPKTLVRRLVNWFAETENSAVLKDILDTPVSPELLPPTEGNISQVTEDLVGPYELHDFYLYYVLRFGFSPAKILYMAQQSELTSKYDRSVMLKWLKTFYRRFFTQQFKRSCMPDGPAVGTVSLSPRGGWKMPSDASGAMWQKEVEKL